MSDQIKTATLHSTNAIFVMPDSVPLSLASNAQAVLAKRYLRRGAEGQPVETIEEMFRRVARAVAEPEALYGGDAAMTEEAFYRLLTSLRFFPNSPTFTGAGTPLGQLAACFVLPISDDMGRRGDGIFQTLRDAALIQQTGGGNGFSFSRLRPKGSLVNASAGQATGPVGFLRVYDKAFGEIAQGGSRRGANMGVLRVDHPDIEEFVTCKTDENAITNFNISVGITDAFMEAVKRDAEWELRFPDVKAPHYSGFDGSLAQAAQAGIPIKTHKRVRARELFEKIARQAHHNGEPGVLFLDAANRDNPVPHLYQLETTNPCVTGDTLVAVADGRGAVSIRQLAEEGHDMPVYCRGSNGITIRWGRRPRKTRIGAPVFKVTLDDGSAIRATANHKFLLRDGTYRPLSELEPGDRLMPFNKYQYVNNARTENCRYWGVMLNQPRNNVAWAPEHRLIMEFVTGKIMRYPEAVVHHKDFDGLNNRWDNLEVMTAAVHDAFHRERMLGDNNPMRSRWWERLAPEEQASYRQHMSELSSGENNPRYGATLSDDLRERIKLSVAEYWSDTDHRVEHGERIHAAMTDAVRAKISIARIGPRETRKCANPNCDQTFEVTPGSHQWYHNHACSTAAGREAWAKGMSGRRAAVRGAQLQLGLDLKAGLGRLPLKHEFMQAAKEHDINPHIGYYWPNYDAFLDSMQNANHRVISVEFDGYEDVYNITIDEFHNLAYITDSHSVTRSGQPRMTGIITANCGEQFLGPYENCCLGSINLAQHVRQVNGRAELDWAKLEESVVLATHFLDNVVTVNKYVPPVPELQQAALRARRIGLGIMGVADLMYCLDIRYGSPEAQDYAGQVMEFVRYHAMLTSIELAKQRGSFPAIEGSLYDPANLQWQPPQPLAPRAATRDWGRPPLDWQNVVSGISAYGIRNAAQCTIAPTGTIGTVAGCEGYGCEPVFALAYIRHVNDNGRDMPLTYASPLFEQALIRAGVDEAMRQKVYDEVMIKGSCQDVSSVPEAVRHSFVVSQDITPEEHVRMQAALQRFVDNSISKTTNLPSSATEADVAEVYMLAWELGCKGLTVYVTGSRDKVVLETRATKQAKSDKETGPQAGQEPKKDSEQMPLPFAESKKPRPKMLPGQTFRMGTPLGTTFVTINENGGGEPFEVFMHTSKAGSETYAVSEAMGRLISYILRLSSPISPTKRLREVVTQLNGIGGGRPLGFGPNRVLSLPDGVARVLGEYLDTRAGNGVGAPVKVETLPQPALPAFRGDLCPECGAASVVQEEGCRKCYSCGYSQC